MGFLRLIKHHTKAVAVALLLAFPFVPAMAQTAPSPNNPSFSTLSKFTYLGIIQNLRFFANNTINGNTAILKPISTLGQSTTYTIPDPAAATDTFATLGVSNAFTGTNTFSPGLESSSIGIDVIQHATVALTSANLLGMAATPVQLVAAPAGATQNIIVHKVMFTMTRTATAYASGGVIEFQIGNTATGAGTATTATVAASVLTTAGAATTYNTVIPVSYVGTPQTGLFISNQTGAFTTGTGTAIVDIWYSVE